MPPSSPDPAVLRPDPDGLAALLTLRALPGLGDERIRLLLERHGSPEAALAGLGAVDPAAAAAARSARVRGRVETARHSIAEIGAVALVIGGPGYPQFAGLADPPPILFALGDRSLLDRTSVAVVGSRRHTEYGADATRWIVGGLVRAGVVVASGLAHGIDRIAHEAALDAGGRTFAVIGCGIDVEYPATNAPLQRRIRGEGLLLSEFLPGDPALPYHFPKRNRLLAALTAATVVVEAAHGSGSLITAGHALDLGRDVFAVPGPIGRSTSDGTNRLIRDGAGIVTGPDDILLAIGAGGGVEPGAGAAAKAPGTEPALTVWSALAAGPMHVDDLSRVAGVGLAGILQLLLEMELEGQVRQLPGKRFGRAA